MAVKNELSVRKNPADKILLHPSRESLVKKQEKPRLYSALGSPNGVLMADPSAYSRLKSAKSI